MKCAKQKSMFGYVINKGKTRKKKSNKKNHNSNNHVAKLSKSASTMNTISPSYVVSRRKINIEPSMSKTVSNPILIEPDKASIIDATDYIQQAIHHRTTDDVVNSYTNTVIQSYHSDHETDSDISSTSRSAYSRDHDPSYTHSTKPYGHSPLTMRTQLNINYISMNMTMYLFLRVFG